MADQELDRSEQATPFKLQKAREQGQTARSADVVSCLVWIAAMLYLASQGPQLVAALLGLVRSTLGHAAAHGSGLWPPAAQLAREAGWVLLPFLLLLPLVAVLGSLAQTGPVLSATPLQPDLQRLNPATGLQRVFSMRTLFDGARACLKLLVLLTAAALALQAQLPQFHGIAALPPAAFLHTLLEDVSRLGLQMGLGLAIVAAADLLYTRREFASKQRMSRRELRDEFKNREGDPRIRARLRELRRELLRRSLALKNTRTATVVLTNPTHYAVALRYVHGEMEVPRIVAKGAGQLAAAMRAIAARHQVVVVQSPPLARRLFREAALEADLPPAFHAEVARILVWVLARRREQRGSGGAAP